MNTRSLPITLAGWLFVAVGLVSLVSHLLRLIVDSSPGGAGGVRGRDLPDVAVAIVSAIVAITAGALVLRRRSSGRWLCAAWLGFHVLLSLVHSAGELAVHAILFAAITYLLFRPGSAAYFRSVDRPVAARDAASRRALG